MIRDDQKISYAKSKSKAVKIKEGTLYQREPIAKRSAGDDTVDEQNKKQKTSGMSVVANIILTFHLFFLDQPVMNNILFLSNLPTTITQDALTTLFNKYPGMKCPNEYPIHIFIFLIGFKEIPLDSQQKRNCIC